MSKTAQQMLDLYLAAEEEVLAGKSTSINGRTYTTEDLGEIRKGRQEWYRRVAQQRARTSGRRHSRHSLARL